LSTASRPVRRSRIVHKSSALEGQLVQ